MYIKMLLNYILGYINIIVEGYFLERFINICINRKILIWNSKREKDTILKTNIGIKDFKIIKQIAKTTKCRIKIKRKQGLPFIFNRYRKRKLFFLGLIVIFATLIIISNFIWNIEIDSTNNMLKQELMIELNNLGLKVGMLKNKIDTTQIINEIRLKRDDIAWMGIKLLGTNAKVEIIEAEKKPQLINEGDYCNIVSDKEAIITKVTAQNGTILVKEGDLVKKGTTLIGGWLEGKYTGTRYVHASGEIKARVWYTKREKIYLNQEIKTQTGNIEKKYSININNFTINLYKKLSKFKIYDTISVNKKMKLFSNFYLPIEIIIKTNHEKQYTEVAYSKEEAKQIGIDKLTLSLDEEIINKDNIINKQVNIYEYEGYIEIEVIYEVMENIGTEEKIVL